jgi:hypothetical protein
MVFLAPRAVRGRDAMAARARVEILRVRIVFIAPQLLFSL